MGLMATHTNDETKQKIPGMLAVGIAFLLTSWISTGVRFWVRKGILKQTGWDDYFMAIATMWITIYAAALIKIATLIGNGSLQNWPGLVASSGWIITGEATYLQAVLFLKLSLGVFFLRIVTKKWQRNLTYGIMIFSTVINIGDTFFVIFMCGNPHGFQQRYITGQCTSKAVNETILFTHAATTTLTDLLYAVLPVFVLWHVKLNTRKKLSVGFILSLGLIGTVCSAVRFNFVQGLLSIDDFFWSASSTAIWSMIEPGTGIMAANLVTMRPLFMRFLDSIKTVTRTSMATTRRMSYHFNKNSSNSSFINASLSSGPDRQRSSLVPPEKYGGQRGMGVTTTVVGGVAANGEDLGGNRSLGRKWSSAIGSIRRPAPTFQGVGRSLSSAIGSITRRGRTDKITVGMEADPEKGLGGLHRARHLSQDSWIQKEVNVDMDEERRKSSFSSGGTLVDNSYEPFEDFIKRGSARSRGSQEEALLQYPGRTARAVTFLENPTPERRDSPNRSSQESAPIPSAFERYVERSFM